MSGFPPFSAVFKLLKKIFGKIFKIPLFFLPDSVDYRHKAKNSGNGVK